jgi:hypothetical protein
MPLWSERILLALLEGHPLAGKEVVYWTDLRGETVLLSQYDPGRELECDQQQLFGLPFRRPCVEPASPFEERLGRSRS